MMVFGVLIIVFLNNIIFNITIIIIAMKQQPKKGKIIKKEEVAEV